jgi:hypothetical protein
MRSYSIDTLTQHKETVAGTKNTFVHWDLTSSLSAPKKPAELSEKLSEIEGVMEKLYNQGRVRGLAAGIHYEVRISNR